jgi:hypothetical protein
VSTILPLTIESLVAILLLLTILYCVRLNDQLKRLKTDETAMRATIVELVTASETAERAIAGLKLTLREAEETLGERLRAAESFSTELARNTAAGTEVLDRLTQIAGARPWLLGVAPAQAPAAPEAKPSVPSPRAIMRAAQAVADRARARVKGLAA